MTMIDHSITCHFSPLWQWSPHTAAAPRAPCALCGLNIAQMNEVEQCLTLSLLRTSAAARMSKDSLCT